MAAPADLSKMSFPGMAAALPSGGVSGVGASSSSSSSTLGSNGKPELRVGGRYRLGRKIGSGSFGDIYLGSNINCFPARDHQLLTEAGWMYLRDVAAHFEANQTLKVACYEDGALEYHTIRAENVSVGKGDAPQLHIAFKGATAASSHVDLLPTGGHNMFVQTKQNDADKAVTGKQTALEVFQLGLGQPTQVQLVANFEAGVKITAPDTKLPFEEPLGLTTSPQVDAFLWLYGQWRAIVREQRSRRKRAWLTSTCVCVSALSRLLARRWLARSRWSRVLRSGDAFRPARALAATEDRRPAGGRLVGARPGGHLRRRVAER